MAKNPLPLLAWENQLNEAIVIFKLNLELHQKSANAYDNIAVGYEAVGNKQLALANFKKPFELNPKNEYAASHIKMLEK